MSVSLRLQERVNSRLGVVSLRVTITGVTVCCRYSAPYQYARKVCVECEHVHAHTTLLLGSAVTGSGLRESGRC